MALLFAAGLTAGCDPMQNSRVARGQLVTTGVSQYDEYFHKVHDAQTDGLGWADERTENRKAVGAALGLPPRPSADTLVAALRERMSSGTSLGPAVETMARAELARAERVEARAPVLEDLANQADDLRPRVKRDLPPNSPKRRSTENELAAAADELRHLAVFARSHGHEARRFVSELSAVTKANYEPRAATPSVSAPPSKKPARPASTPKPAEPKKAAPEVFTP